MIPCVADAVRQAEAEIDKLICDEALKLARECLEAGATPDDLPVLLQPFIAWWRPRRAEAVAKIKALAERVGQTVH